MKIVIFLFAFSFMSSSLFSQMNYFTGMGPMTSKAIDRNSGGITPYLNNYFALGGIKFPFNKKLNFLFQSEWNRTSFDIYFIDKYLDKNIMTIE